MPLFEFKCVGCSTLTEKLYLKVDSCPDEIICERCGSFAPKCLIPSRISISRSSMDNPPIDSAIGREAERKWDDIKRRQEIRDKVRTETGKVGLSEVAKDTYIPVTDDQIKARTDLKDSLPETKKMDSGTTISKDWLSKAE